VSILVAIILGLAVWPLRSVGRRTMLSAFAALVAILAAGVALGLSVHPWTNIPVAGFALAGGVLVGRGVPPRARAMLPVLACLAAFDVVQVVLIGSAAPGEAGPSGPPSAAWYYGMLVLDTPWTHSEIGVFDLLLVAAVAEHGRRRGLPPIAALTPGPLGFLYANITVAALNPGNLALIPFLFLGWITVELIYRFVCRGQPAATAIPVGSRAETATLCGRAPGARASGSAACPGGTHARPRGSLRGP
jgi:hypothetical protein